MKFKLPVRKSELYTYQNKEGETVIMPAKTRKMLKKSMSKATFYPDNEVFTYVTEYLNTVAKKHSKYFQVKSETCIMALDYMSYQSTKTTLDFSCGLINLHSRAKSLDITRVIVDEGQHGKGFGTFMMMILMSGILMYTLETNKFPKVILECVGGVGLGKTFQSTPVEQQVKFFKKFGFELERVKDDYHHMLLTKEGLAKLVSQNPSLQILVKEKLAIPSHSNL